LSTTAVGIEVTSGGGDASLENALTGPQSNKWPPDYEVWLGFRVLGWSGLLYNGCNEVKPRAQLAQVCPAPTKMRCALTMQRIYYPRPRERVVGFARGQKIDGSDRAVERTQVPTGDTFMTSQVWWRSLPNPRRIQMKTGASIDTGPK
jgi:hypothetical protein